MIVYTTSPSLWSPLILAGLLGLYLVSSRSPRQETPATPLKTVVARVLTSVSARATAPTSLSAVDPVDTHAARAIAICNGRPQLRLASPKGHTR